MEVSDVQSQSNHLLAYDTNKSIAFMDALKNELWTSAVSGDNQQLALLLEKAQEFNLNDTYKGINLVQAMFKANSKQDLPFKTQRPDYTKTLSVVIKHGFDFNRPISLNSPQTSLDICKQYLYSQNNLRFYQSYNPIHFELLREITSRFADEMRLEQTTNKLI